MANPRQARAWAILAVIMLIVFALIGACSELVESFAEGDDDTEQEDD